MMNGHEGSDRPIVPAKSPNNGKGARATKLAEGVEGRGWAKGNARQQNTPQTQSRNGVPSAPERIREAAKQAAARYDLRQEPSAVRPLAGICAGGAGRPASLPRPTLVGRSRSRARTGPLFPPRMGDTLARHRVV